MTADETMSQGHRGRQSLHRRVPTDQLQTKTEKKENINTNTRPVLIKNNRIQKKNQTWLVVF